MKTVIYYFTGTGNSLVAARRIATDIEGAELYPISKIMAAVKGTEKKLSPNADTILIVTPIYVGGLPSIVADFISRLKVGNDKRLYAIGTYGGFIGAPFHQIDKILSVEGSKLSGGFGIRMPGNCVSLYGANPVEKQEKWFAEADKKLAQIAGMIKEGRTFKIEGGGFFNTLYAGGPYRSSLAKFKELDKNFYSEESCDSCGLCVRVCPVSNISLENGKPKWHGACEQCMACIQWCPKEAIQIGTKTKARKRYHHPQIKAEDIMRNVDDNKSAGSMNGQSNDASHNDEVKENGSANN